jgi:hypothetical protein
MKSLTACSGAMGSLTSHRQRVLHGDVIAGIIRASHLRDGIPSLADPGSASVMKLISFDIDGTLEVGDPPGLITMDMVRKIKALGYVIGSGSDRPLSYQRQIWESHHLVVDFTALKHQLADVKARFQAEAYYHIGDTDMDRFLADRAGFRFVRADAAVRQAWGPDVFP